MTRHRRTLGGGRQTVSARPIEKARRDEANLLLDLRSTLAEGGSAGAAEEILEMIA